MKMKFLALACATAMSFMASAYVTNIWQNASGGSWGEPSNWSLDRVPTSDDWVELPSLEGNYTINVAGDYQVRCVRLEKTGAQTVTLTGAGSITSGINDCYVRENRALILDGPSFIMTKANFMLYGPVTVKSGSVLNCVMATMWLTAPALHVESGGSAIFSSTVNVRSSASVIDINGGTFQSPKITRAGGYTNCGSIRVSNGGSLSVQTLDLDDKASVSLTDGSFSVSSSITMSGNVNLTLTGGTLTLPEGKVPQSFIDAVDGASVEYVAPVQFVDGPVTDRSVLESLDGDSLVVASDSDTAVHLFSSNAQLDDMVEVGGALYVTNGCINFNRRGFMGGDYPVFTKRFRIGDQYGIPTIGFPTIVFGANYPFTTTRPSDYYTFYLEGPTEFRATADTEMPDSDTVVMASGDIVVDTRDWNDGTTPHRMVLNGLGAKDAATLTVRGGGEILFKQAHSGSPFSKVEVENGTTLTLLPHLSASLDYGPLHTDEFVLGPNSVLNIPAGSNSVRAAKWTVDPSATINVIIPEGLSTDAKGLMYDFAGTYRVPEAQIHIIGAPSSAATGWGLLSGDGTWALTNALADLTLETGFEWTGAGIKTYKMFEDPNNWNANGAKPIQANDYVFGASNETTLIWFYRVYGNASAETATGSTVNSIRFRNTATKSFTITNTQMTVSRTGDYGQAGISSFSTVPQYFANSIRTGSHLSIYAATEGPLVFNPTMNFNSKYDNGDSCKMRVAGDVRFGRTISWTRADFGASSGEYAHLSGGTRITVLAGGNLTYTNQTIAFTVPYAGFRVSEGGSLTFSNGGGIDKYQWSSTAYGAKNTIDGVMNINVPFCGGNDHSFGGSGTLNLTTFRPVSNTQLYTRANRSRVSFGDTLTVHASSDWTTVAEGADYPLVIRAYGTPTIRTDGDWTYGPAAGFEPSSVADVRAAEIAKASTLTVDPSGGTVTFADPVGGKGTLAITNGVLRVRGGTADTLGVVVKANGVFEPVTGQTLRSVRCENGGILRLTAFEPVTVKENVNLGEINLAWPANLSLAGSPRWRTVLVSKTGFTGEFASTSQPCVTRVVETVDGFALQLRRVDGLVISFR